MCAADEVWRLQRGSDEDCLFFQRMVNNGKRILDRGSRQGLWVCAPSGKVLARINSRNVPRVLEVLEAGKAAWAELPAEDRRVPEDVALEPSHRWEMNYPAEGLVLERIARDHVEGAPTAPSTDRWNRDFAWFSGDEVRAMLQAEQELGVGDVIELPLLARRLARFHLVDNVHGQTIPFADDEVTAARLSARVIARDGDTLRLELSGATRAEAEGPWLLGQNSWKPAREHPHGIAVTLFGEATVDLEGARFTAFELMGTGRFHGRTVFNARRGEDPAGPIAFHMELSRAPMRVAPAFVSLYDGAWIRPPAVSTWLMSPQECGIEEG